MTNTQICKPIYNRDSRSSAAIVSVVLNTGQPVSGASVDYNGDMPAMWDNAILRLITTLSSMGYSVAFDSMRPVEIKLQKGE